MKTTSVQSTEVALRATEAIQHGRRILVGAMSAHDLATLYDSHIIGVDVYSTSNPDGYQRTLIRSRSRRFGRFASDGIAPTAILLYVREPDRFPEAENGIYSLPAKLADAKEKPLLWLADGQHRTDGISEAFKEGWLTADEPYDIPVTILFWDREEGAQDPRLEEATQFYTINQEQKRMRTDLAHQYIFNQYQSDKGPIGDATGIPKVRKREYVPYEIYISRRLNKDTGSPWNGLISTPNTSGGIISEGSFTDSLLPVMDYAATAGLNVGETVKLLKNFWTSVLSLTPNSRADPESAVLQKTAGVSSLHIVLPTLLIRKPNLGKQPSTTQLSSILQAAGDKFTDDYWESKNGEAASFGTGRKSSQELAKDIIDEI